MLPERKFAALFHVLFARGLVVGAITCSGLGACNQSDGGSGSGASGSAGAGVSGSSAQGGGGGQLAGGSSGTGGGAGSLVTAGTGGSGGSSAGSGGAAAASGSGGSGGAVGGGGSGGSGDVFSCTPGDNILTTGNDDLDEHDCVILELAQKHSHPDPRILKSQMMQESSMQTFAVSPDSPCGQKAGWSDAESKSFGLTQVTPACGEGEAFLLPDGHPNMTQDMGSPLWETSVFNPELNIEQGFLAISEALADVKSQHSGCTEIEYTLMAAGAYNSGAGTIHGCNDYEDRPSNYINAVLGRYQTFAAEGGWPNPYPNGV